MLTAYHSGMAYSNDVCAFNSVKIFHLLLKWVILGFNGSYSALVGHEIFKWVVMGHTGL